MRVTGDKASSVVSFDRHGHLTGSDTGAKSIEQVIQATFTKAIKHK